MPTDSIGYVDVHYLGHAQMIATGVLETADGLLLVDPGPTVSLDGLEAGLRERGQALADVRGLLLTHIHLDHAGAAGTLAARIPGLQVYVHRKGARHLAAPERLLRSAERIYGDDMDTLWGAFEAVPEGDIHALDGGETLLIGGRAIRVAYTPGHALHHVSYLDERTGTAFAGDTAGMRLVGANLVWPVTPPPDIHLEQWAGSLAALRDWGAEVLFTTHFGPHHDVSDHLDAFETGLRQWSERVYRDLAALEIHARDEQAAQKSAEDAPEEEATGGDAPGESADEARPATTPERAATRFHRDMIATLPEDMPASVQEVYARFGHPETSWHGLARYWRRQG